MELTTIWFILITILWTGYFVLEGFDFGVGATLPLVARGDAERRQVLGTIGPVWDGNEVWLITAIGATFAAFPAWYAGLLSSYYLAMLLVIVALIVRGIGLEWRGKVRDARERTMCVAAVIGGSVAPPLLWGGIFGHLLAHTVLAVVLGALLALALATLLGAVFTALKTDGPVRARARRLALTAAFAALPVAAVTLPAIPGAAGASGAWPAQPAVWATAITAMAALAAAVAFAWHRREALAFTATAATIVLTAAALFAELYRAPLPGLTVAEAASGGYTLTVMTWIGVFALPFVLAYQAWTYWVFRKRLTAPAHPAPRHPATSPH